MHAESRITFGQWASALVVAMALHAMLVAGLPTDRSSFGSAADLTNARTRAGTAARIRLTLGPAPAPAEKPARAQEVLAPAERTPPVLAPVASLRVAAVAPAEADAAPALSEAAPRSAPQALPADSGIATEGPGGTSLTSSGVDDSGREGNARADYYESLFAQVVSILDYPTRARLQQIEGTVVLALRIDRSGRLESCEVVEGSGSPLLDRHALRIARRAAPFGPVPASFEDVDLSFELPLAFALR